jgi:hypothetical protein
MAEWRETGRLVLLHWYDVRPEQFKQFEELTEEIGSYERLDELLKSWQEEMAKIWVFSTQEEAWMFASHEVFDRAALNQDQLPPAFVRELNKAIQEGRHQEAVTMWMVGTQQFFQEPEMIVIKDWPMMAWVP